MSLHFYAEQGDIKGVIQALNQGEDVNALSVYSSRSPLVCATESNRSTIDVMRCLIERGADVNQTMKAIDECPLLTAVRSRSLEKMQLLLEHGAEVRPKSPRFRCLLYQAMEAYEFGLCPAGDSLSDMLALLISQGASLDETLTDDTGRVQQFTRAITSASTAGQFDIVKLLIEAGADASPLGWSDLMYATVLEPIGQVKKLIADGADLTATDHRDRTAWLLSLAIGDLNKARLLLWAGSDPQAIGDYDTTPAIYAAQHPAVLEWLINSGFDYQQQDYLQSGPLATAAMAGSVECMQILVAHGVDPYALNPYGESVMGLAHTLPAIRYLNSIGIPLNQVKEEMKPWLTGVRFFELGISQSQFLTKRTPRFGQTNPEVITNAFWRDMVATGYSAYKVVAALKQSSSKRSRSKQSKSKRSKSKQPNSEWSDSTEPIWCFQRFGQSLTALPDGRLIAIAGEHEDFYDPNFCIYNDVVVYDGKGDFEILGYPQESFPPTDFHTATLVNNTIYIIGNLGYKSERRYGETPVYQLNCNTFKIKKIQTTGNNPGWIHKHTANCISDREIEITGGSIMTATTKTVEAGKNSHRYRLDLDTLTWSRLESSP